MEIDKETFQLKELNPENIGCYWSQEQVMYYIYWLQASAISTVLTFLRHCTNVSGTFIFFDKKTIEKHPKVD